MDNYSGYDDNVGSELNKMTQKTTVRMKARTFSDKDLLSIIAFLKDYRVAYDACNAHKGDAMCFLKE